VQRTPKVTRSAGGASQSVFRSCWLDVKVRLAIYEHPDGKTRVGFNTASSLMSGFDNDEVQTAALKLDAKMVALGETVTGAKA
jgi:hypothetical protein